MTMHSSCCRSCPCNGTFLLVLLVILGWSLVSGAFALVDSIGARLSLGDLWLPLSAVAVGGTLWGLWQGFRMHGNAQPLAVGIFALAATGVGLIALPPVALIGAAAAVVAAVWSARAARATI